MPTYRRKSRLEAMGEAAPSEEEIETAWRQWHEGFGGEQVYFVQRGYDPEAPIKIGLAKNPARRIAELQTACAEKLVVLARCSGNRSLEREYHARFAAYRLSGEWFDPAGPILAEIERLRRPRGSCAVFAIDVSEAAV